MAQDGHTVDYVLITTMADFFRVLFDQDKGYYLSHLNWHCFELEFIRKRSREEGVQIFMGGKYLRGITTSFVHTSHLELITPLGKVTSVEQVWRRGIISQYKSKCYYGEHVESQPVLFPSLENTKPDILLENSWLSVR